MSHRHQEAMLTCTLVGFVIRTIIKMSFWGSTVFSWIVFQNLREAGAFPPVGNHLSKLNM